MPTFVRGRDTRETFVHRPGAPRRDRPGADWVPTTCRMCNVGCQVLVRVEDGRIVNVIGNPDAPRNRGRMCAKGKSGIMNHYQRERVLRPRRRTNPDKGIGVDPRWEEISWEDALELIAGNLRGVVERDPRGLYLQTWADGDLHQWLGALAAAAGTPYLQTGVSGTCGKTIHSIQYLTAGGWWDEVDFAHCRYLIDVGTQQGIATREGFNHSVPDCASARVERNMKLVVVDPVGNNAAAKADEWLPIRPGTDAAFGLGMLHVLLNELGVFDAEYLRDRTNAPYLVGSDGRYVRDPLSNAPLVWDVIVGEPRPHDHPELQEPALVGEFTILGRSAKPAFQLLKERVAAYPPERVEEITTVPAVRLRRITREFGEAAQIGATITIDGTELPYRPVALNWCRGPQGHKHAWHHTWALQLVNVVLGCINVPGGYQSRSTARNWPDVSWPLVGRDGMMVPGGHGAKHATAFPGRPAARPERTDLFELFPVAAHTRTLVPEVSRDPARYGIDHRIEMLIHTAGNQITGGWGDVRAVADWYRSIDFVVGFAIEINETHEFDDIVLPMPTYLEENTFGEGQDAVCGEGVAFHAIQQQVIAPPPEVRHPIEVLQEVCARAGLQADVLRALSRILKLRPEHELDPEQRYTHADVIDRQARSMYGDEHGWDYFREHGLLVWERGVPERYPGRFIRGRIPIYMENFIDRAEELAVVIHGMGIEWDLSDYDPLPAWLPCASFEQITKGEIDAIGVHYKLPYVYGGQGNANPWIDELCDRLPQAYGLLISTRLAERRGIHDGDWVELESPTTRARIRAHVTECVHPEVVGIAGHAGHWASGKQRTKGKGVNFNSLLPYDMAHLDTLTSSVDMCAPLTIRKAREGRA